MKPCKDHGQKAERYGFTSRGGKTVTLHRIIYCESNGVSLESIKGLVVMHSCDNPRCIEPTHLSAGTQQDNMKDRDSKGRTLRGQGHPNSKLSDGARAGLIRRGLGGEAGSALGREFGISGSVACRILKEARCQLKN